ncbi:uncharacterized protein LOC131236752 [Magnolia sinica]|uniref:uncharacterized protein LOC131236752 n=1 Tax=Magnolia sinica TaxID=86752 RepID=UPI002658AE05|nr:uncharacterized protein LOC131236752 [Magnolia sinica]
MGIAGASEEALSSPRNRVKFLCSHGGKILPRPSDGLLKYVGGETRVVAVPRNVTFSELMKKLASLFNVEGILKYQLVPEDLDALVSVTCDEDIKHMLTEYDRHDTMLSRNSAAPRLRAFLFPSNPVVIENHIPSRTVETNVLEQRYIDAINGFVRTTSNVGHPVFSISSSAGSPRSTGPDTYSHDSNNNDATMYKSSTGDATEPISRYKTQEFGLGRVRSSPNLLSTAQQPNHHQHQRIQSRLGRQAGNLQTVRSDNSRYQIGQLARRYCVPIGHHQGGSSGRIGYGHMEGSSSVYRNGGS